MEFRIIFDEHLKMLDFKTNTTGFYFIQKDSNTNNDYRRSLANLQNVIK